MEVTSRNIVSSDQKSERAQRRKGKAMERQGRGGEGRQVCLPREGWARVRK